MIKKNCLSRFKILILFLISLAAFAYGGFQSSSLSLPITSDQLIDYYKKDSDPDVSDIYLLAEYKKKSQKFNEQEIMIPIKGDHFSNNYGSTKIEYFEIGHFKLDDYLYKLIIYNRDDGVSDTVLLNIQLNSYTAEGILIDALLLDSRFGYEDIERFSDFVINNNKIIEINYYIIRLYGDKEYGYLENLVENPVPDHYAKEQYKINEGIFKLTTRWTEEELKNK